MVRNGKGGCCSIPLVREWLVLEISQGDEQELSPGVDLRELVEDQQRNFGWEQDKQGGLGLTVYHSQT